MTGVYHLEPAAATVSYEYYTDEGALKYWLVPNGEDIELHGMFRSGDPETYEDVYILDGATAEHNGDYVTRFTTVFKSGSDVSTWFKSIVLSRVQTSYILSVERDEKTLAGGGSDNVLSGSYTFDPFVRFAPLGPGPFTEEDLGVLAQRYYFVNNGFFPPEADVEANDDGSFTVHLYEVVTLDDTSHTATSAWYTVDANGKVTAVKSGKVTITAAAKDGSGVKGTIEITVEVATPQPQPKPQPQLQPVPPSSNQNIGPMARRSPLWMENHRWSL